ncbi:hypothetical protein ACYQOP_15200 [Methylobacterium sp. CM6247]
MERTIVAFVKPLALALICFVSILYISKNVGAALVISLVPLLLGWLGIMETFAYAIAAVVFLAAVTWAATPVSVKGILAEHSERAITDIQQEIKVR